MLRKDLPGRADHLPMPRGWRPAGRFVAPRFDVVEGGAGLGQPVRYACAVTTECAREDGGIATWLHVCQVRSAPGRCDWRTVTAPLETAPGGTAQEGRADSIAEAIACAVRAIPHPGRSGDRRASFRMAPAFVETWREPGAPRIWLCAFLLAADPSDPDWNQLQRCSIREFPGQAEPFLCQVESLPRRTFLEGLRTGLDDLGMLEQAGLGCRRWRAPTLAEAMRDCVHAAMDGAVMERRS
jgi:hypothetical protein